MKIILSIIMSFTLLSFEVFANQSDSLAYGVRAKFGLFDVYGINIYSNNVDKICTSMKYKDKGKLLDDNEFLQNLRSADLTAKLNFMRDVDANTIAEAIIESLDTRLSDNNNKSKIIEEFLSAFSTFDEIKENDTIVFEASRDTLMIEINNYDVYKKIQSQDLVQAFFSIYTDNNPVIEGLVEQVINNVRCKKGPNFKF